MTKVSRIVQSIQSLVFHFYILVTGSPFALLLSDFAIEDEAHLHP